ncbi:LysR family transcriptional regulator [Mesorhizobium sp. Z1-4]|uniref:LysR family transcriptional regulator n=1 Tax=Mesorhizobium sp. Z1-4 TaxID=2448478 RepID=UPI0013E0164C|nr:LysR family transcriptional regulator [Mesorhizobium sp. Z1-4]
MKLRQLRYLVEITKQQSFGRAALQLRVAQPALSYQIRNLEDELGVQLFIRHAGGVVPTDAGKSLYHDAIDILARVEQAKANVLKTQHVVQGHVSVGMIPSACLAFGQEIVDMLAAELPGVTINIAEGFSSHIEEWLVSGEVDLAVFYPSASTSVYEVQPLIEQTLVLAGAFNDDKLPETISDFETLMKFPLVSSTRRNKVRKLLDAAASKHDISLPIAIELDSLPAIKDLVIRGGRYAILEPLAIYREVQSKLIKPCRLVNMGMSRTLYLGWATSGPLDKSTREVARRLERLIPRSCAANPMFTDIGEIDISVATAI